MIMRARLIGLGGIFLCLYASQPSSGFELLVPDFLMDQAMDRDVYMASVAGGPNHNFIISWEDGECSSTNWVCDMVGDQTTRLDSQ